MIAFGSKLRMITKAVPFSAGNAWGKFHDIMVGKKNIGHININYSYLGEPHVKGVEITDPKFKGKRLGKKIYGEFVKQHGVLHSDSVVSEEAQRVWHSLGKRKDLELTMHPKTQLGYEGQMHTPEFDEPVFTLRKKGYISPSKLSSLLTSIITFGGKL